MGWTFVLNIVSAIGQLASFIVSVFAAFYILNKLGMPSARSQAAEITAHAVREAESIVREAEITAKTEMLQHRSALEQEIEFLRKDLREHERRLEKRSETLEERQLAVIKREQDHESRVTDLKQQQLKYENLLKDQERYQTEHRNALLAAAGMAPEDAKKLVLESLESAMEQDLGRRIIRHEKDVKERNKTKSVEILSNAIQRYAAAHTAETTTSVVDIPSDDIKGRIIGREGRNIRAFERITGVDVIVDDTPGVVIVSAFDSIRRETARLALEKLIQDGRIHPSRIEEIVRETEEEMQQHILLAGQEALREADLFGVHEKLIMYLGRLKYRTSYSQNVLRHSLEVAYLTGMMAEELGLDGRLARRCGLFHDIGKAAEHEMEGTHTAIGAELNKRYGESPEVVHAALGHHDDLRSEFPYTVLVAAADAISASRPGARRDTLDRYVRRLEELETICLSFPGVHQAFAIQAGREVRVIADSEILNDESAAKLSWDIARAIQEQLKYPGEVRVTVIRETRNTAFAR